MKSDFKRFLEASKSNHQDLLNDTHRVARGILDVKELLEKVVELKDNPDIKKAITKLEELDVEVEYISHQIESLD